MTAEQLAEIRDLMRAGRDEHAHFDLVTGGDLPGETPDQKRVRAAVARETGATWWLEWAGVGGASFDTTLALAQAGPPAF